MAKVSRKHFLATTLATTVAVAAGCGQPESGCHIDCPDESPTPTPTPTPTGTATPTPTATPSPTPTPTPSCEEGAESIIAGNHGHAMTVSAADIAAGVDKNYTMSGGHAHDVFVTSAHFATIAAFGTVQIESSGGGAGMHTHLVTIRCD